MNKIITVFVSMFGILFTLLLFSCASINNYEPGTSNPVKSDYTVLAEVEREFSSNIVLGVFSWGDDLDVLDTLKEQYNADDIINVAVSERYTSYFWYIFFQKRYVVTGTAIKYNN